MDENLGRGYMALGKRGNVCPLATPPVDHLGKTYLAMVLAGVGFLFPYYRYPTANIYPQRLELFQNVCSNTYERFR